MNKWTKITDRSWQWKDAILTVQVDHTADGWIFRFGNKQSKKAYDSLESAKRAALTAARFHVRSTVEALGVALLEITSGLT